MVEQPCAQVVLQEEEALFTQLARHFAKIETH